jgi:hypothetical protein
MADPVSLLGTIAGVVSLGASLSLSLYDVANTVKTAPRELAYVASELSLLSQILVSIREFIEDDANNRLVKDLIDILFRVNLIQRDIEKKLKSGGPMDRIKWIFKSRTVKDLLIKIETQKSTLNTVLSTLMLAEIKKRIRWVELSITEEQ